MTTFYPLLRTQSGESGNTLKSQVEVLRQTREQTSFRAYNEDGEVSSNQSSVSDIMPYAYKTSLPQNGQLNGCPLLWLTPPIHRYYL